MSNTSNDDKAPSLLGADGKPTAARAEGKRFAIVGKCYIHYTVFELEKGEDEIAAVKAFDKMCRSRDPKLAELTKTEKFYWCEDDTTRENARMALLQSVIAFFSNLLPWGQVQTHMRPEDVVKLFVERSESEKETGDTPPVPPAAA